MSGYKASVTLYEKGNPMPSGRLAREFAKLHDAEAWLTGARDMFTKLRVKSPLTRFELRNPDGHLVSYRSRGREL